MPIKTEFDPDFNKLFSFKSQGIEEYGRFQQHLALLEDSRRISQYIGALAQHAPGNVIIDVGSGTGILGICGLKRGFDHAILIEPSKKMCAYIQHLAELNDLGKKITIINKTLENVDFHDLPANIDLVISETISSLIFGFGCWDTFPSLMQRVIEHNIIPQKGRLFCSFVSKEYSTRGFDRGGIALLKNLGIKIDLFERTFRSGGNVYDKSIVREAIQSGDIKPVEIASFDFSKIDPYNLAGGFISYDMPFEAQGLILFWEIQLDKNGNFNLSNLDDSLTSWYPYYVPLKKVIYLQRNEKLKIKLKLHEKDVPYKYSFQFMSDNHALTNILYW